MVWMYDAQTRKERALRKAGFELFAALKTDRTTYGWAEAGTQWDEFVTRFNSQAQATDYAYQKLAKK